MEPDPPIPACPDERLGSNTSGGCYLFVTGMPRSGTTLLDKLLSAHPDVMVLSQPLPLLYVRLKQAFLDQQGQTVVAGAYPLNDMMGANYYDPARFLDYLRGQRLGEPFLRRILGEMVSFSGQYTKPDRPFAGMRDLRPSTLIGFVRVYTRELGGPRNYSIIGSKETFCEEFIPYFVELGARVIQVLRDPRDVIASLNFGRGVLHSGPPKPHLFNLRQWRKSVSFALRYQASSSFLTLRYEDLVTAPSTALARIARFLGLDPFPERVLTDDLYSQTGAVWRSNSSHRATTRIGTDSVSSYRRILPPATIELVESLCYPEMLLLGYEPGIHAVKIPRIWDSHQDTEPLFRPELAHYLWSTERAGEEKLRWEHLRNGQFLAREFIFRETFDLLRHEIGGC